MPEFTDPGSLYLASLLDAVEVAEKQGAAFEDIIAAIVKVGDQAEVSKYL